MYDMRFLFILGFFVLMNSLYADGVKLWKNFDTSMDPEAVANELNSMNLFKKKAKVKKIPKNPKYKERPNTNIPVITASRLSRYFGWTQSIGLRVGGFSFTGPIFQFDADDKLAEVWFKLSYFSEAEKTDCSNYLIKDINYGFETLITMLSSKYELLDTVRRTEVKNAGTSYEKSNFFKIAVLSDEEIKVWLTREHFYEDSNIDIYGNVTKKCDESVGQIRLQYADKTRTDIILQEKEKIRQKKQLDTMKKAQEEF